MTDSAMEYRPPPDEDRPHSPQWYICEHADEQLAIEREKLLEMERRMERWLLPR